MIASNINPKMLAIARRPMSGQIILLPILKILSHRRTFVSNGIKNSRAKNLKLNA